MTPNISGVTIVETDATVLASVMFRGPQQSGQRVGVILSGGNVGLTRFRELTAPRD